RPTTIGSCAINAPRGAVGTPNTPCRFRGLLFHKPTLAMDEMEIVGAAPAKRLRHPCLGDLWQKLLRGSGSRFSPRHLSPWQGDQLAAVGGGGPEASGLRCLQAPDVRLLGQVLDRTRPPVGLSHQHRRRLLPRGWLAEGRLGRDLSRRPPPAG